MTTVSPLNNYKNLYDNLSFDLQVFRIHIKDTIITWLKLFAFSFFFFN